MRAPARLLPILLAGFVVAACSEPIASIPPDQADAGGEFSDAGPTVDDAGHHLDAGLWPPDAGSTPDAGEAPDAGSTSDAGEAPDAGSGCVSHTECEGGTCVSGECVPCDGLVCGGRCVDDLSDPKNCGACGVTCDAREVCFDGDCSCPALGCGDVPACAPEALATTGCGTCLTACLAEHEREELEIIADAFRSFRKDTGGWPYFETDWSIEQTDDRTSGGVDPTRFIASDVALFSQGSYISCQGLAEPQRCWYGPYLQPGRNLVSDPWLDAWGRVRMFSLVPPDGADGAIPSAPEGAVVIWSSGPDGLDQTGCTPPVSSDPPCIRDIRKIASGQSSVQPSDDVIVFIGSSL